MCVCVGGGGGWGGAEVGSEIKCFFFRLMSCSLSSEAE